MSTIYELFKVAGFADLRTMTPYQGYAPKVSMEIEAWDETLRKSCWKRVNLLFYKGESNPYNAFQVIVPSTKKAFLCTGEHLLFSEQDRAYYPVKSLSREFMALDIKGNPTEVIITKVNETFPVLDVEVEGVANYFSGGIVSHNSFGGGGLLFSEGLKKLNPYISRFGVSMNMLTQMRAKVGFQSYGPPDAPSGGGYAPRFYASWRARVSKGEEILDGKEVIGNQIKIKNSKSKIGFPKREAILDLYYGSGFNSDAEYTDFIIKLGFVKKSGAWYSQEDWKFKGQGTASLLTFLQNKRDLFEKVKAEVNATFNTFTLLDDPDAESTDDDLPDEEPLPEEETV